MAERPRGWNPKVITGGTANPSPDATRRLNLAPVPGPAAETVQSQSLELRTSLDMLYFIRNIDELAAKLPNRIDEINAFIKSLKNYTPKVANVMQRREGIAEYSLEALVQHLQDSSESDWGVKPAFYRAVMEEYGLRIRRLQDMNERMGK